jgi:hypothetical protein
MMKATFGCSPGNRIPPVGDVADVDVVVVAVVGRGEGRSSVTD